MSEVTDHIKTILDATFKVIDAVYNCHQEKDPFKKCEESRLVFPRYSLKHKDDTERDPETRVSEQELRFVFVEQFNRICDKEKWPYYYSVETPTEKRYVVSKAKQPRVAEPNEGVSGAFDLVIHDGNGERICRIEFKAGMSSPEKEFAKDFLKLNNDSKDELGFFVHLLEPNANQRTFTSIRKNRLINRQQARYVCHVINGDTYSVGCDLWNELPIKKK